MGARLRDSSIMTREILFRLDSEYWKSSSIILIDIDGCPSQCDSPEARVPVHVVVSCQREQEWSCNRIITFDHSWDFWFFHLLFLTIAANYALLTNMRCNTFRWAEGEGAADQRRRSEGSVVRVAQTSISCCALLAYYLQPTSIQLQEDQILKYTRGKLVSPHYILCLCPPCVLSAAYCAHLRASPFVSGFNIDYPACPLISLWVATNCDIFKSQ